MRFDTVDFNTFDIVSSILLAIVLFLVGLLLFWLLWSNHVAFYLPRGQYYEEEETQPGSDRIRNKGCGDYLRLLFKITYDFDAVYWTKYVGIEGYSFILFVRKLISALLIYTIVDGILYCIFYLILFFASGSTDLFEVTPDTDPYIALEDLYAVTHLISITALILWKMFEARKELRAAFIANFTENEEEQELNWLMLRTIELEGARNLDLDFSSILNFFKEIFRDLDYTGKVLACVVIPDYSRLFKLEKEREKITLRYSMFHDDPPLLRCFANKEYLREDAFHKKMQELNYQIDKELTKPLSGSRTAFIAVDSMQSVKNALKRATPKLLTQINQLDLANNPAGHDSSDEELEHQQTYPSRRTNPFNKKQKKIDPPDIFGFPHPTDINWLKVEARSGTGLGKRILLQLASILVLIFLTTPAAFVNFLSTNQSAKHFLSLDWVDSSPAFVRFLLQGLTPAIIILIVNEILLWIIGMIVNFERRTRFSFHQISYMKKVFVYLLFNMLIVPGLAASAVSNIFDIINVGVRDTRQLFTNLFAIKTGNFFMILVINGAGGAFLSILNYLGILFKNYLSPSIAMETKIAERRDEQWQKDDGSVFGYGGNYAIVLVLLGIGIVFHSKIPYLALAVAINLTLRMFGYAHQLLIWHRLEFESMGNIVSIILPSSIMLCIELYSCYCWHN
jgi:hypothetical protein